jgi:hypothetical protein
VAIVEPEPDMLSKISDKIQQVFDRLMTMAAPQSTAAPRIADVTVAVATASPTAGEPIVTSEPVSATTTPVLLTATATRMPATATRASDLTATSEPATATATTTATPLPALTATPKPAIKATVTRTLTSLIVSAPTLAEPPADLAIEGNVLFRWLPSGPLPPKTAYEIVAWGRDGVPANALGIAAPTTETSLAVNLDIVYQSRLLTTPDIYWTVLVVNTEPYERLTQPESSARRALKYGPTSDLGPPPKPKD